MRLRKSSKLLMYDPLPKPKTFHCSGATCRAAFGGNRSGKTTSGGMEFLFHTTGIYPEWYPEEQRYRGAVIGRIIAKDFQKGVGEVIVPFFEEWLDPQLIERKWKNPQGIPIKWKLRNGSVFDILTHEQSTEQFEGWRGHIAWFDEPPPRDKYVATIRGMVDYNGRHWLTLTPLTQPWIYDEIYTKQSPNVFSVTMDIRENKFLTERAIKEFESQLTEEEKEARLHGRFLHLSGLIYKEFMPEIHVCSFQVKKHWTRYMAIDPHERTPTACLWLAVDEQENHWIYDELWLPNMDVKSIAQAIQVQEGDMPARVKLIDPHADKENMAAGGFNFRKELMRYGVYTQRANVDMLLGPSKIRQALTPRYNHMLKKDVPQQHVSRECRRTFFVYQHYFWDDFRRNKEEYDPKEKPKAKNNHFMDCMKYIYNFGPRYVQEEQEEQEVEYGGTYTKYPIKTPDRGSYHDLVEPGMGSGKGGHF